MLNATAHAASSSRDPCDQVGRDLQSLEVPVYSLTVDMIDHVPIDPVAISEQSADADPVAPVLHLTPRVTNILRDVFGPATEGLLPETTEQPSSSPVAGSDAKSDGVEPVQAEEETSDSPRFRQQMLRTDI
jgi:hypothetical protein